MTTIQEIKKEYDLRTGRNLYSMPETLNNPEEWHKYLDNLWDWIIEKVYKLGEEKGFKKGRHYERHKDIRIKQAKDK